MADVHAWQMVLTLDEQRAIVAGDPAQLRAAIGRGADLRIYSTFRHNEHIDTASDDDQLIEETMDMRATYLIDGRWCGGILTLRQPVSLPDAFGPRPSLSLFMYNENGEQAIARPYLDGPPSVGPKGASPPVDHGAMPKYHEIDRWDDATNGPSSNFVYDFGELRYLVRDDWTEVLSHDADGRVRSGSVAALRAAFADGADLKVGVSGLCHDLAGASGDASANEAALAHEVFIQAGSCYYYTRDERLIASTHPVARVAPAIPLRYRTANWDYAWLVVRTDGHVARLSYDPYTLQPIRATGRHALRWFVR